MSEAQGFGFEPSALRTFAETTSQLCSMATEARSGLSSSAQLPGGAFGEVGQSSGFLAAYRQQTSSALRAVDAVSSGVDGLATAVRNYCTTKLNEDDDRARDIQRAART